MISAGFVILLYCGDKLKVGRYRNEKLAGTAGKMRVGLRRFSLLPLDRVPSVLCVTRDALRAGELIMTRTVFKREGDNDHPLQRPFSVELWVAGIQAIFLSRFSKNSFFFNPPA